MLFVFLSSAMVFFYAFQWFDVVQLPTATTTDDSNGGELDRFKEGFELVHNLAQLVHANAQGKIGSGFDVAAAVYGELPKSYIKALLIMYTPQAPKYIVASLVRISYPVWRRVFAARISSLRWLALRISGTKR